MAIFLDLHRDAIGGTIATFDRLIFKGHLNTLFPQGAFKRYLDRRDILLKDAGSFFENETARLKARAKALADDSSRPFVYLNAAHTHATGTSKESLARRIAEDDGVTQGLVCAFSALEPCRSFTVAGNRETKRLEVVRRPRQCLHFYWYLIDPEFGWMHVRLRTWAPYEIQVYVNGRAWLARRMDQAGLGHAVYGFARYADQQACLVGGLDEWGGQWEAELVATLGCVGQPRSVLSDPLAAGPCRA